MADLPEDKDERRMFDESAKTFGGPLRAIANCLTVWGRSADPNGSFGKTCIIMANEVRRVAETNN